MKTRTSFVANSSSSSFIVAIKSNIEQCSHCGRRDMDLIELIEKIHYLNNDTALNSSDTVETIHYINEHYNKELYEELVPEISKYLEAEEWNVIMFDMSRHDEITRFALDNLLASKNAEILYSSGD